MHIHIHICIYTYTYTNTQTHTHIHIHIHLHMHLHTRTAPLKIVYGHKSIHVTYFCPGFPREQPYKIIMAGGERLDHSPAHVHTFPRGLRIPGDSWGFSNFQNHCMGFIHSTYVLGNHSLGIPRDSYIFIFVLDIFDPLVSYFPFFGGGKVVDQKKHDCLRLSSASRFWRQKTRPLSCHAAKTGQIGPIQVRNTDEHSCTQGHIKGFFWTV